MASTIPRTGLKRMGLTILLIIIYIFVGLKIIVAYSADISKQATKTVSKEMLQTHVDISHSKNMAPTSAGRSYRRHTFIHYPTEME